MLKASRLRGVGSVHKELKEPGHHLAPSLHPVSESFDSLEGGRALFPLEMLGKLLHALDPLGCILQARVQLFLDEG
jgi:hypothetical protein